MFKANQILHTYLYREIYENSYSIDKPDVIPTGKILFAEACYIRQFFETLSKYPERKVVVISSESDFGPVYQSENRSNTDLHKAYCSINWDELGNEQGYVEVVLKACKPQNCTFTDRFAAKMDRMTDCTFDKIPDNVHAWFCCNAVINEPRVEFLPFGVNTYGDLSLFEDILEVKKLQSQLGYPQNHKSLYINFDINTYDRFNLKKYWMDRTKNPFIQRWATYVSEAKPVREYYKDILDHDFNLSPKGNGTDGYRNYETLYLGRVPILQHSRWSENMIRAGFPIMLLENLYQIDNQLLNESLVQAYKNLETFDKRILTKDYWFNKIWEKAKEI